jgi:Coenzyme A transferase
MRRSVWVALGKHSTRKQLTLCFSSSSLGDFDFFISAFVALIFENVIFTNFFPSSKKKNRLGGNPETLIRALSKHKDAVDLTIVSLTGGTDGQGIGLLLEAPGNKVKRLVSSYVGENKFLERQFFSGHLQVELVPQGTIAQRLQAAGAGTYVC